MVGRLLKPDARYRTKMILGTLLIFAFFIFPWALMGLIPDLGLAFFLIYIFCAIVALAISLVLVMLYVPTISYEIGEEDIIVRKGLITRTEQVVPYRTITNVDVKRTLLDRWLGIGSIVLHTAGYSQTAEAEGRLAGLANYDEVRTGLVEALRRFRGGVQGAVASDMPVGEAGATLDDVVAELRALRESLEKLKAQSE